MTRVCDANLWEANPILFIRNIATNCDGSRSSLEILLIVINLEGAAFVYVQAVSTCIACHEHCRDVLRIAQIPNANGVISIPTSDQIHVGVNANSSSIDNLCWLYLVFSKRLLVDGTSASKARSD